MHDTEVRLDRLQRQVQRLSRLIVGVGLPLVGVLVLVATMSPDNLIVRSLHVVDTAGKPRFVVETNTDGTASFALLDSNENPRFRVLTDSDAHTELNLHDANGTLRFAAEKLAKVWGLDSTNNPSSRSNYHDFCSQCLQVVVEEATSLFSVGGWRILGLIFPRCVASA